MGRISTYDEAVAAEICNRLAEGEFLRVICRDESMPNWRTVYDWKDSHPEFAARIARARIAGADAIAEDSLMMLDEKPERVGTMFGDKVDSGYVQWQKNRSEQRLKLLAKWDPRRYGDKLAIGGADDLPPIKSASDEQLAARIKALQDKLNAADKK